MGRSRLPKPPEPSALPMATYFVVVGGALAVLLLIAGWSLPELPDRFPDRPSSIDAATIRIKSARKWPEKVVFDANQPTISPPSIEAVPTQTLVERLPDEQTDRTRVDSLTDSITEPEPGARPIVADHPPMRARRKRARTAPPAHVARASNPNELYALGEECCWFESTDRRRSGAGSHKRVARRDSWAGWHFPEAN